MTFSKKTFLIVISMITLLTGCSTSRFENNDGGGPLEVFYPVQSISVPQTMSDLSTSQTADASSYEKEDSQSDGRMANLEMPENAVDLFPASISGVWNLSIGGKVCRIATPQTKFGQGYRAGPLHCPGIVSQVNSWTVKGKRLYFYNKSGRIVVTLYSSNVDRFEGRTIDNYPVVLSR
ncbi:AprI/Inh family metalloprotease inhibitor [Bartonella senegalensis]|uniref:AprI/Inh family metalloprotease inhibitor n=1 Tax=Bartonella senegalensis TaxID=1468418 RepID=UPI0003143837|nr:AprI/Inh family metalloprotease inhibitor [Bartonella senegalensis]